MIYLIKQTLWLRLKLFGRFLDRLLVAKDVIGLLVLFFLLAWLWYCYSKASLMHPAFGPFAIFLLLIIIHNNRKDLVFLYQFKSKGRILVIVEYWLLSFLLCVPVFFREGIALYLASLFILATLLPLLFKPKGTNYIQFGLIKKLSSLLPAEAYEWQTGLRKTWVFFGLSYLLDFAFLFFAPVTPFFMFFWLLFCTEFYQGLENKEIVQSFSTANSFLKQKSKAALQCINMLFLPHYMLFCFLYSWQTFLALLLSIFIFNLIVLYALFSKYARLNFQRENVNNGLAIMGFSCISFVLPLSLFLIYKTHQKALCRLKKHLY